MIEATGYTYTRAARRALKAMGGRFDPVRRCWLIPDAMEETARALLAPVGVTLRFVPEAKEEAQA